MDQLMDELKTKLITQLKLSDVTPADIDPDAPLIGGGLGLDSIDTLEILVILQKDYAVTVPDVNEGRKVFASLRSLAQYITDSKVKN
ncbi:MAG: phosphopantetheine-binding protein [Fibrobacterota bacterium]|nr:phosphopantetheine-binding protein [Chitinispirillaceae bacterium]